MTELPVKEYALKTGKSEQTIKRWLKSGKLSGHQSETPQGFMWYVDVDEPADPSSNVSHGTSNGTTADIQVTDAPGHDQSHGISADDIESLKDVVGLLKQEIENRDSQLESRDRQMEEKDKQIEQLHILLKQAQDRMLPEPTHTDPRPWWMRMLGIQGTTQNRA